MFFCPRCDKAKNTKKALDDHIDKSHPEYDPDWKADEVKEEGGPIGNQWS